LTRRPRSISGHHAAIAMSSRPFLRCCIVPVKTIGMDFDSGGHRSSNGSPSLFSRSSVPIWDRVSGSMPLRLCDIRESRTSQPLAIQKCVEPYSQTTVATCDMIEGSNKQQRRLQGATQPPRAPGVWLVRESSGSSRFILSVTYYKVIHISSNSWYGSAHLQFERTMGWLTSNRS
jgi:hypothetical protein